MTGVHIEARNLARRYGGREVLRGVDLEIFPGEFLAVVGASGCGKTTLLRLIAGLEEPSSGAVIQDGGAVDGLNRRARLMFQDDRLLPWERVAGNVGLGLAADRDRRVASALARVGLADRARDWPSILSGGQRQRVALARALAGDPGLLLLDEPLGALDALTRIEMQALVEQTWWSAGFTAILVTHDVEEAVTLADRVIAIDEGRITFDASIALPRPRQRDSPEFARLARELLDHVMQVPKRTS
jgi:sulfonate transport system ATP-binding protein